MPYRKRKLPSGKYRVTGPSGVHAKSTTKAKAEAQIRIMEQAEHGKEKTKKKRNPGEYLDHSKKKRFSSPVDIVTGRMQC
jgi:hypothetical protein